MLVRSLDKFEPGTERQIEREFISLSDIVAFFRQYLVSILLFALAGCLAAAFHIMTTDRIYSAGAQILIEPKLPQYLQQSGGPTTSLDTAQIESQIAVMKSEKIAQMVIDELSLIGNPDFFVLGGLTIRERLDRFARQVLGMASLGEEDVPWLFELLPEAAQPEDEAEAPTLTEFERNRIAIGIFGSNTDIRRVGVSYAVATTFRSRNAQLAADIANATAQSFLREQIETKAAAARQGGEWLERRMAEMRAKMNTATQIAQEFRAQHDYRVKPPGASLVNGLVVYDNEDQAAPHGPTLEELEVTADTYRQMYESFLRAYMDNLSQQSYVVADARVISEATRPLSPSHPRKKLVLAFGLMAGLMAGIGVAFLRNTLNSTIRSKRQLSEQLGLRCLGELPAIRGTRGGFGQSDEVSASPGSAFSENLKRAKFEIRLAGAPDQIRSVGITSVFSSEGKGTVANNLALLYALSGQRTLLVDADTDYPHLSRALLARRSDDQAADRTAAGRNGRIVRNACGEVDLLPVASAGGIAACGLPDLAGYDIAVVNLPSLASGPESLAISAQLSGVVVVAEWGTTAVGAAGELVSVLHGHNATIFGALLTKVRYLSKSHRRSAWRGLGVSRLLFAR